MGRKIAYLGFQFLILVLDFAAIVFDLLQLGAQHEQLLVSDLQLLLGAMHIEQRRHTNQQTPPGPVAHSQKGLHIALNATHRQLL